MKNLKLTLLSAESARQIYGGSYHFGLPTIFLPPPPNIDPIPNDPKIPIPGPIYYAGLDR